MENEVLALRNETRLVKKEIDGKTYVYKILNSEYPSAYSISAFYNEASILGDLKIPGTRYALKQEKIEGKHALVFDYIPGSPLSNFHIGENLDIRKFLKYAIEMADILDQLHNHLIIHRDIKPSNFIVNGHVVLIDFHLATKFDLKMPFIRNPNLLQGTIHYLAPERTGRINRKVDYRSDLYSLGATFYEVLVGHPPFPGDDPLKVVHAHIAINPDSPSKINREIPVQISEVVLKLLEKNAENRYQSALALKQDLEKILDNLERLDQFKLEKNAKDTPIYFLLPDNLYGREKEIEILTNIFDDTSRGGVNLVNISGFSGIGKSALVQELFKSVSMKNGFFIQGKFDQIHRNIPYHALIQALSNLIELIISEEKETFEDWKKKLSQEIGEQADVLIDILPEFKTIFGDHFSPSTAEGSELHNKIVYNFSRLIQNICSKDFPLLLFLDDLQWSDQGSIDILRSILSNSKLESLMVICSYRSNEINEFHSYIQLVNELQKKNINIHEIALSNLGQDSIQKLCSDTIHISPKESSELASTILGKTGGNIFFAREFFQSLYQKDLIVFNSNDHRWQWDIEKISRENITSNLVHFLRDKILLLDEDLRKLLQIASCSGIEFDLNIISRLTKRHIGEISRKIGEAIREGVLYPASNNFQFVTELKNEYGEFSDPVICRFVHDKLQEAVYQTFTDEEKIATHLFIGHFLYDNLTEKERENEIHTIANHFIVGRPEIKNTDEKFSTALICIKAGIKARRAAVFKNALHYFKEALEFLTDFNWQESYEIFLELYNLLAENSYYNGEFEASQKYIDKIFSRAKKNEDTLFARNVLLMILVAQNRLKEVVKVGREALKIVGITFPKKTRIYHILKAFAMTKLAQKGKPVESILELPQMTDSNKIWAMQFMDKMTPPSFRVGDSVFPLLVFKQAFLSLKYGNTPVSIAGYSYFSIALVGVIGDIENGYRFGQLCVTMSDKIPGGKNYLSHSTFVFNNFIEHWKTPLVNYVDNFMKGYQIAIENGHIFVAAFLAHHRLLWAFFCGRNLTTLQKQFEESYEIVYADKAIHMLMDVLKKAIDELLEPKVNLHDLFDYKENSQDYSEILGPTDEGDINLKKELLYFIFDDWENALIAAKRGEDLNEALRGMPGYAIHFFYSALIYLNLYGKGDRNKVYLKKARKSISNLEKWASLVPETHEHRYKILKAVYYNVTGKQEKAKKIYEEAINIVRLKPINNPLEEGVIYEQAAEFFMSTNQEFFGTVLLQYAYSSFERWGSPAKLNQIQKKYERIFRKERNQEFTIEKTFESDLTTRSSTNNSQIDLYTILRANQIISREIDMRKIVENIIRLSMENAGADKAVLLVQDLEGQNLEVMASCEAHPEGKIDMIEIPYEKFSGIPRTVIQYVILSKKDIIISNTGKDAKFQNDKYIVENRPKSILCVQIIQHGRVAGILYLENKVDTDVFTEERIQVLNMINTQSAISIYNAQLYQRLEFMVEERTRQLNQSLKEIQRDMTTAYSIQKGIIPPSGGQIGKFSYHSLYKPVYEVGGDIFDISPLGSNGIRIFLADATGHGVQAALITMLIKAAYEKLKKGEKSPGKILKKINDDYFDIYMSLNIFFTAIVVDITPSEKGFNLIYSSAGHPMQYLDSGKDYLEFLEHTSPIVGLKREFKDDEKSTEINERGRLVLFTDGLFEEFNSEGKEYTMEKFLQFLETRRSLSAETLCSASLTEISEFMKNTLDDDATMIVVDF